MEFLKKEGKKMGLRNGFYDSSILDSFGSQGEKFSASINTSSGEVVVEFFSGNGAWEELRLFVGAWLNVGATLHLVINWHGPSGSPEKISEEVMSDLADRPIPEWERPEGWITSTDCPVELAAPGSPRMGSGVTTPQGEEGMIAGWLTGPPRYRVRVVRGPRKKRISVEIELLPEEVN
ncbi:MAG: hypothetical protein AAB972_05420 [Patescibacteria group bacterium]